MPTIPGGWELVLILLVVMVLFGAKRLPDSARSLGRSMRILKAETKGLREDDADNTPSASPLAGTPLPPGSVAAPGQPASGNTAPYMAPGHTVPGYTGTTPVPEQVDRA